MLRRRTQSPACRSTLRPASPSPRCSGSKTDRRWSSFVRESCCYRGIGVSASGSDRTLLAQIRCLDMEAVRADIEQQRQAELAVRHAPRVSHRAARPAGLTRAPFRR